MKQIRQGLLLLMVGREPHAQQFPSKAPETPLQAAKVEFESHCPGSPQRASSYRK